MGFERNWTPAYESKEAEADRELRRQALRQQQMQYLMSTVMQGVGMGIANRNADANRAQDQQQFDAASQQRAEQFMQDLNYRISTRDRALAKVEAADAGAQRAYESVTGIKAPEGATADTLNPLTRDVLSTNQNLKQAREMGQIQIEQTPDLMRARAEAEFQQQTAKWGQYAEQTVKSLPALAQMGVLKPEEADHLAQVLQASPQSAIDVQKLIDHRMVTMYEDDWTKLQDMQYGQRLGALAMDPGNMGGFTDEERKRALFASKRIEAGLWGQDEAKLYTYTGSPFKATGGKTGGHTVAPGDLSLVHGLSPDVAAAVSRMMEAGVPVDRPEVTSGRGENNPDIVSAKEALSAARKEADGASGADKVAAQQKVQQALNSLRQLRARGAAPASPAASPEASGSPNGKGTPQASAAPKDPRAASAFQKFKAAKGRDPNPQDQADVEEMARLIRGG